VVRHAVRKHRIVVLDPTDVVAVSGLGVGESATIHRAAIDGLTAVIDDLDARRAGTRQGIALTGTIALLVRLAETGGPPISESLDALDRIGFRVSAELRAAVMAKGPGTARS
jgi:predicted nucleic acid-binding protein